MKRALVFFCLTAFSIAHGAPAPRVALSVVQVKQMWEQAIQKGINNKTADAIKDLQRLLTMVQPVVGKDQIMMAIARLHYQVGRMDLAIQEYEKIDKKSDFWLEALEEKAWAYARQGRYEKALSQLNTILSPVFAPQVGPEPYLLSAYVNLKICDYNAVFQAFKGFKEKFKTRLPWLEKLSASGQSAASSKALAKMARGPVSWTALGSDVDDLPRFYSRDEILLSHAGQAEQARERTKEMARDDIKEITDILHKLQIVEAEAIQRMGMNQVAGQGHGSEVRANADNLVFPKEDEIWLDELDHYHVSAKGCAGSKL